MKATKITYWITTTIISLMMLYSGYMYFTSAMVEEAFVRLGFPDYFRVELGVFKLLGAVALLAPLPSRVKEWTYAGFAITFLSAFIAHVASGDEASHSAPPIVFLVILIVSYITYYKKENVLVQKAA